MDMSGRKKKQAEKVKEGIVDRGNQTGRCRACKVELTKEERREDSE